MQSLDDARFALLRDVAYLLQNDELGPNASHAACLAAARIDFFNDGDITPWLLAAHWILGSLNDKEVALMTRHFEKDREIEELDSNLRNALVLANKMLPAIAREMMFDDVVQTGNRVRKKLAEMVEDEEGRFDIDKFESLLERFPTISVQIDSKGQIFTLGLLGMNLKDQVAGARLDMNSEAELALREKYLGEATIHAADMFLAFPNLENPEADTRSDDPDFHQRIRETAEKHTPERYWGHVAKILLDDFRVAYAKAMYADFGPDTLGLIEQRIEVDGKVVEQYETKSAHDAERWYTLQVSERSDRANEYVVLHSAQPTKCIDAKFCRSKELPSDIKVGHRERNQVRWRQFWARPVAWVGPTSQQILAVGSWCSGDPEDPSDMIDATASQICGVTNRTWRAWAAENSSQKISYPAWHLLLVYADVMERVGRRTMGVGHD